MVILSNVSDTSGNFILEPVTWSFTIGDFGVDESSVLVSGIRLSTSYSAFLSQTDELSRIQSNLLTYLNVASYRISDVSAFEASDKTTAIQFVISPFVE